MGAGRNPGYLARGIRRCVVDAKLIEIISIEWSAIAARAAFNVVQVGIGLKLFGPYGRVRSR